MIKIPKNWPRRGTLLFGYMLLGVYIYALWSIVPFIRGDLASPGAFVIHSIVLTTDHMATILWQSAFPPALHTFASADNVFYYLVGFFEWVGLSAIAGAAAVFLVCGKLP